MNMWASHRAVSRQMFFFPFLNLSLSLHSRFIESACYWTRQIRNNIACAIFYFSGFDKTKTPNFENKQKCSSLLWCRKNMRIFRPINLWTANGEGLRSWYTQLVDTHTRSIFPIDGVIIIIVGYFGYLRQ